MSKVATALRLVTFASFTGALVAALTVTSACSRPEGDDLTPPEPGVITPGQRIQDALNPEAPTKAAPDSVVRCSGAAVTWVDSFDETHNGKSSGTIYVQDLDSQAPWSGIGMFGPAFIPSSLRVSPGDVLDLKGTYQENANIGTAVFPEGQVLPQLFRPVGVFRFEGRTATPADIDYRDLTDYAVGRRWIGMLVRVHDVTVQNLFSDAQGRVTGRFTSGLQQNPPVITNELYDLKSDAFPPGTKFASVTGIVTYFFALHLAPRSAEDFVR